jgi:hypothetical protein
MNEVGMTQALGNVDWTAEFQRWTAACPVPNQAMTGCLSELGSEVAHFVSARLRANLDTMQAIAQCCNLPEVMNAQQRWVRGTFDDYATETSRLTELNGRIIALLWMPSDKPPRLSTEQSRQPRRQLDR